MTRKQTRQQPTCGGLTRAQIEAMLKGNTWWPFTRVDPAILNKVYRDTKKRDAQTQTQVIEEALL